MERQTDYTIMEGYELPSKGKIYAANVDPHVELRSMTARDEMKGQSIYGKTDRLYYYGRL